jgi:hypothetical protein
LQHDARVAKQTCTHTFNERNYKFDKGEEKKHGYVHPSIINDMYDSMNATFGQNLSFTFTNWNIEWNYEHKDNN